MLDTRTRGRALRRALIAGTVLSGALWVAAIGDFITPPALVEERRYPLNLTPELFPPGSSVVEIALPTGDLLRGRHIPSDTGAPLIVHFAESGAAVREFGRRMREFTDRGFASLAVDYRGVGYSYGDTEPDELVRDALSVYAHALELVHGDEQRLVLRGTSLGTLVAAGLLREGARPAAVILYAPVLGETVARRFGEATERDWLVALLAPFLAPVTDVDMLAVLAEHGDRVLILGSEFDELTSREEFQRLRSTVLDAGGEFAAVVFESEGRFDSDHNRLPLSYHVIATGKASDVRQEELALLGRLFPDAPDVDARLANALAAVPSELRSRIESNDDAKARLAWLVSRHLVTPPRVLTAYALGVEDREVASSLISWEELRLPRTLLLDALTPLDLVAHLDLTDPAGPIPGEALRAARWALPGRGLKHASYREGAWTPEGLLELANLIPSTYEFQEQRTTPPCALEHTPRDPSTRTWQAQLVGDGRLHLFLPDGPEYSCSTHDLRHLRETLEADALLSPEDRHRRLLRLMLKAATIPDRVVATDDGGWRVEAKWDGEWVAVEPEG